MKNYTFNTRRKENEAGFTLVESLVAISILMIAVIGPMFVVSQALKTSYFSRDQITSFYLAQEAIEYVRNVRDRNSLTQVDPADWLDGIVDGQLTNPPIAAELDGSGMVKYTLTRGGAGYQLTPCPSNVCPKISLNKDTGVYGDSSVTSPSMYTREIVFYKAPGDADALQEVTVEVTMKWQQIGGTYQYKLRENITNWKIQNFIVNEPPVI